MRKGFAPDCDPDKVMPATEIGLQAMLAAKHEVAAFTEYRASRRLGCPPELDSAELRDLARLTHAGVFNSQRPNDRDYRRDIAKVYVGDRFDDILALDHPNLVEDYSPATAEEQTGYDVMRDRIDHLAETTGVDTHDLGMFHRRIGIHPTGAEYWLRDDEYAEEIRQQVVEQYPCELYSHGAVHDDFAVDI